jgi:O-antigen/teichoic acid export membrane protein
VAVLGALSAAGGTFMARPFLASWVGPGFAAAGAPILQVALLSSLCLTLSALLTYATDAINRPEAGARSSVVMVILSVAATLPLLWWLGPVGAAWGFMLGSAVQLVWLWIVLARVLDPRDARRLVRVGALQPLALFLVAYAVMRLAPALVAPAWQQVPALAVWLAAVLWALRRAGSWQRFMLLGVALPLALFHLACEAHRALPLLPPLPGPFWRDLPSSIVGGVVGLALAAALGAHRSVARAA